MQDEKGQPLPGGRSLVDIFVDAEERGALRPLPFDPARHVMLSEELKHLYTAVSTFCSGRCDCVVQKELYDLHCTTMPPEITVLVCLFAGHTRQEQRCAFLLLLLLPLLQLCFARCC